MTAPPQSTLASMPNNTCPTTTINNTTTNNNKKNKLSKHQNKNESSKQFQNNRNLNLNLNSNQTSSRSKSPRKKKGAGTSKSSVAVGGKKIVPSPQSTLDSSNSISTTTKTPSINPSVSRDQSKSITGISMGLVSTHSTTKTSPTSTNPNTSHNKIPTTIVPHNSKKSKHRKKFSRKTMNKDLETTTNTTTGGTMHTMNSASNATFINQQQRKNSIGKEKLRDTTNNNTSSGSNTLAVGRSHQKNPKQQGHNLQNSSKQNRDENIQDNSDVSNNNKSNNSSRDDSNMKQQLHQRHSKNYKGNTRKPYYHRKVNSSSTNQQQQERDVNNYKPHMEDNTRTAVSSPISMNVDTTISSSSTGANRKSSVTTPPEMPVMDDNADATDKLNTNVTTVGVKDTSSAEKQRNGSGRKNLSSRNKKHGNSTKTKTAMKKKEMNKNITCQEAETKNSNVSGIDHDRIGLDGEKEQTKDLKFKDVRDEQQNENNDSNDYHSRPLSASSSTDNIVTTNAAGKELLKRLSGNTLSTIGISSPNAGGCTESIAGTTGSTDDVDTSTVVSILDVSNIDLGIEQHQKQHGSDMYTHPNPTVFQPPPPQQMQQQQQQQQWAMPPQSDMSPSDFYTMYANPPHLQQQHPLFMTAPMPPLYGPENGMLPPHPVTIPNVYGQDFPTYSQTPIPYPYPQHQHQHQYQQHQPTAYTAPLLPVKYEHVTLGGCVFFNPVYDNPGDGEGVSVCSTNTASIDMELPKAIEKKIVVGNGDNNAENSNGQSKDVTPKSKDVQKRKGKSARKKKKYPKKKSAAKESLKVE